jgi:two-component system sensor histidine kinase/response regulator
MKDNQHKGDSKKIRVRFWDQMVLIGIGLALFYTVFDSVLYIFLAYDVDFFKRLFGPDISEIWSRITIVCLFIIFGSHAQFTINRRILAESALRESEEKFRTIIETTPDGYFEVDLNGNFTFFNDSMCTILGYSRQEISTMKQQKWLDETNSQKLTNTFHKVLENREPVKSLGWTLISKNGSQRFVESSVSLINEPKGNPAGFGGFIRDVTQRRRAEALYRAKMAAEAASRTKSEFLASMSHEIRTPLNSIIGLVELMLGSDLPPDQREDLDVVKSSAYSLLSIINNILDFSKIEAGKLDFEQTPFSLKHFLDDSLKIMGMKSHAKGIELAYRIAPGVPDRLLGDPIRLRQVLLNLVDNAIKFTENGEVVVLVAAQSVTKYDVYLHISVVDTGIGIPRNHQRSIFGAYNQGGSATTRQYGGTGLGLAVSAQLVSLMGGRIKVRSQPGQGSRFRFTARLTRQQNGQFPPQAGLQSEPIHSELAGLIVLVVDDNVFSRRIIREILQNRRMSPKLAAGAQEAKEILLRARSEGKPFDLIVLDSNMPATDGFALARWIVQQNISDAGIIMMLTFPHLKRKPELEQLGITASVVKPFGALELEEAIKRVLGIARVDSDPAVKTPQRVIRVSARPLKILVAEDTPFNQKFIMRLLERWNHRATLVENGRQALEAWQKESFDVVLMDMQMPEMDGLAATQKIREREAKIWNEERELEAQRSTLNENASEALSAFSIQNPESSIQNRVPIIAMTAHAIKGDRERCLEAGMDEYISKPIDSDRLFEAIEKLTKKTTDSQNAADRLATIDIELLLKAFDGDWSFLKEVVEVFLSDYPRLVDDLLRASEAKDSDLLMRSAHSLKGMLNNFQADSAAEVAFELERKGKLEDFDGVQANIKTLQNRLTGVDKRLRNIVEQKSD